MNALWSAWQVMVAQPSQSVQPRIQGAANRLQLVTESSKGLQQ
jgi:hypothetical protein